MTEDLTMRCPECEASRTILRNNGDPAKAVAVEVVCVQCDDGEGSVPRYLDADGNEVGWDDDRVVGPDIKPDIKPDIWLDLAAAFGPVLKEAFPSAKPDYRTMVGDDLAEQVKLRAHWFADNPDIGTETAELDDPAEATPAEQIGDFINRIVKLAPKAGLHVGITVRPLGTDK